MYILVQHAISDPSTVWPRAQKALSDIPAKFKLHQSIPTTDGRKAVCVWEADSIQGLKEFLDPLLGPGATQEYFEAVNKEGVALPPQVQAV